MKHPADSTAVDDDGNRWYDKDTNSLELHTAVLMKHMFVYDGTGYSASELFNLGRVTLDYGWNDVHIHADIGTAFCVHCS